METKVLKSFVLLAACWALSGCGVAAVPCRVASAGLKAVPIIGHPLASPTDACADAIDPGPHDETDDQKPSQDAPPPDAK